MIAKDFARVRMIALCVFALGMLAVPASAVAAGHHDAKAHGTKAKGKKKKPKKKTTIVLVKCASVTVTCKGTPGPAGPQGAPGVNGARGSCVGGGARSPGPVLTTEEKAPPGCESLSCLEGANVPLSPSSWTEAPTEDDQLIGTATFSMPSETECKEEESSKLVPAEVYAIVTVDGTLEGIVGAYGATNAETVTVSLFGTSIFRFEFEEELVKSGESVGNGVFVGSGSSQSHAVALKVFDGCPGTPVTVSSAAVDVLASF
jgi:hypothetical protein